MVSNPNEAAAIEISILRDKMNCVNVTPVATQPNEVAAKVPTEVTITVGDTDQKQGNENKVDEETTATESLSLNGELAEINSVIVTKVPISEEKLMEDHNDENQDDTTKESNVNEAIEDFGLNVAAELNISAIEGDENDHNQKMDEEVYDEVLHNLDGFDLYKLDYESDHEQDEGLENLQSPVPISKKSIRASWPIAAGGEVLKPGDHVSEFLNAVILRV